LFKKFSQQRAGYHLVYFIATYLSCGGGSDGGDAEKPSDEDSGDGGDEEEWRCHKGKYY
jgi:hypothetical protein